MHPVRPPKSTNSRPISLPHFFAATTISNPLALGCNSGFVYRNNNNYDEETKRFEWRRERKAPCRSEFSPSVTHSVH